MENRNQLGNGEQQESRIQPENEGLENKSLENKDQENTEYQFIREKVVSKRKKRLKRMGMSFAFTVFLAIVFGVVARAVFLYADGPLRRIMGLEEAVVPTPSTTPTPSARPTGRPSDSISPAATNPLDQDKTTPMQSEAMGDGEDKTGATGMPSYPGTPTNPNQTTPTNPDQTTPTNPNQTNPTSPNQTNPTNPDQTTPTNSGQTKPTNPGQSDPTGQNPPEGSDITSAPNPGNPSKNPGSEDNPNHTDADHPGVSGTPDGFGQDGSGQDGSGNNPSGDKNSSPTEPGKGATENDPSGKNESENMGSGQQDSEGKEDSSSEAPEGTGSQTTPEGQESIGSPENPEDPEKPDASGDSDSSGTVNGENPKDTEPSGSPQAGDGDTQGNENEKEDNGKEGNEGRKGGGILGYAAMFAELQEIANQVGKSLVTVTVTVNGIDWLNDPYEAISHTTGVVIEKTAEHLLVLLNLDRIQSASSIQLVIDGENFGAELWNYDKDYNLAVVAVMSSKIPERYWNQVQVAEWGDSASLAAGTPILALGNPNGYMGSMESGMVTSSGSTYYIMDNSVTLFNTNTTDSESGDGVIVNLEGKIIGLITRTMKSDLNASMCTAIGSSNLENVLAKLAAGEKLISFGILGEDIPASVLKEEGLHNGIYVMEVIAESPAFEAGIKTGDIILLLDEAEVYSYSQFNTLLNLHEKGDSIRVRVRRTVRMKPQEIVVRAVLEVK